MKEFGREVFVLRVLVFLLASVVVVYSMKVADKEIGADDYREIVLEMEMRPAIRPRVREAMNDDTITRLEYTRIMDDREQVQPDATNALARSKATVRHRMNETSDASAVESP